MTSLFYWLTAFPVAICLFQTAAFSAQPKTVFSRVLPRAGLNVAYSNDWREVGISESLPFKAVELFLTHKKDSRHKRMIVSRLNSGTIAKAICDEERNLAEQYGKKVLMSVPPPGWACSYQFIGPDQQQQFFAHRIVARPTIKSQKFWSSVVITEVSGASFQSFNDWISSMKTVNK